MTALDLPSDCKSVSFWVCKACGGSAGFRASTGAPGRLLEVERYLIISVPTNKPTAVYVGACECGDARCPSCQGEGMLFVGWGIGWKHCNDCEGSGLVVHRG